MFRAQWSTYVTLTVPPNPTFSPATVEEGASLYEGYCGGGATGGCGAAGAPGTGTEVGRARSWLGGDSPVPGPLPAAAADFGTALGGKLIAKMSTEEQIIINMNLGV